MEPTDFKSNATTRAGGSVYIAPGEYKVASYTSEGPSHSEEYVKIEEPTLGMFIEVVHDMSNVVVGLEKGWHTVLIVDHDSVLKKKP